MDKELVIIILAAGQGTRMKSSLPKVLHPIGGQPMLAHVIDTAEMLSPKDIYIVYGHGGERVISEIDRPSIHWCLQEEQLGTGHAVSQALPTILPEQKVLVMYGDVPLIRADTLKNILLALKDNDLSLLTVEIKNPQGYGRIVRDDHGKVCRIVEEKDADHAVKEIKEVNTGILAADASALRRWLNKVRSHNAQGEFYLTDCVETAVLEGGAIGAQICPDHTEVMGVNDKLQLAESERIYQRRQVEQLMINGATLRDPARLDLRGKLKIGQDVTIDVNVIFEGDVSLGNNVFVGPNCFIKDAVIAADTQISSNTVIEKAAIGKGCRIGPYTRIRPETQLGKEVHLGNFVEIKKSIVDDKTKINHLSYVGDSQIGKRVNVGAGTITCNYDGAYKHLTRIGDDAFIGSDTQLVAPVEVGKGATIGAGSTITRSAPEHQLTLSRANQVSIEGWQRPAKKKD
ncbi:MAG: bifunctional UDP-N-acetylglucosamine diphosphorylase/glucosamine-1-phosphate N-acetyltransferase GlmU [Pseudomonadota bacterium]